MPEVFISYTHADDQPFADGMRGWVTALADRLQKSLAMKPGGASIRVWMDHRLEPNKRVDPALASRVAGADAFLAVLSPRYFDSPWCRDEIEGFASRVGVADERMFLLEMFPTERTRWPAAIGNLSSRSFWSQAFEEPAPMPLGWPAPDPASDRPYWRALNELAHFISERLQADAPAAVRSARGRVWIGDPTDHVLDAWEALAAALRQQGADVLPAAPGRYPAVTEPEWRAALAADFAASDVMVQLLGPHPGRRPPWSELSFSHLQAQAARAAAAERSVPWLAWRSPDVELGAVSASAHRNLLTGALACGVEALLGEVLTRLKPPEAAAPTSARAATEPALEIGQDQGDIVPSVCVQADRADRALGEQVRDLLFTLGVDATLAPLPQPSQPPAEWRLHYETLLAESSGLLIVYGDSPPSWVQAQVQSGRKTLARLRRGLWGGLLDAPPGTQPDHGVRSHGLMLLDCRQGLAAEPLRRLIDGLRASAGG